jgi:hypothetical protein
VIVERDVFGVEERISWFSKYLLELEVILGEWLHEAMEDVHEIEQAVMSNDGLSAFPKLLKDKWESKGVLFLSL